MIHANGNQTAVAAAEGIGASFGITVNKLLPTADVSGAVRAYVGENTTLVADGLDITADGDIMHATANVRSGTISGFASVSTLSSLAKVTGEVEAFIGAQNDRGSSASAAPSLTISGGDIGDGIVVVDADATMDAVANTYLVGASFGLTVSKAEPKAELSGKTRA